MAVYEKREYVIICDRCKKPARYSYDSSIDTARHRALGRDWKVKMTDPYEAYCPECRKEMGEKL